MRPLAALRSIIPVGRGELAIVGLLATNVFVLLTTYYVLKVVREPLILIDGGAEVKAYASAGQAGLLSLVVPAFGALAARTSRIGLVTTVQTFFIGCLVLFYSLARLGLPIGVPFYMWVGIFNVLVISNFWSFANDVLTPEQGKRLFALIGLGGSIGAIAGAIVAGTLERHVGLYELMPVAAGGLAVSTILYRLVDRTGERAPAAPMDRSGGFAMLRRDRYLRLVAIMVILATLVNTTGEYVVGRMVDEASHTAPDRGAYIASFYASYYGLVNLVSAAFQGLAVARVLAGVGVRRALWVMPLIALGNWLAFLVSSTVAMIRLTKTIENSVDYSLHNTVRQALFLPTSRDAKYKAKAAIDTFIFRVADVIAGFVVVYALVHLGIGVKGFAVVNLAVALLWLVVVDRTGRLHDELAREVRS